MLETQIHFDIDGKEYILFIEKRIFSTKYYLFRKRKGSAFMNEIPVKKIRNSTLIEDLKYCPLLIKDLLRKKRGNKKS